MLLASCSSVEIRARLCRWCFIWFVVFLLSLFFFAESRAPAIRFQHIYIRTLSFNIPFHVIEEFILSAPTPPVHP